MEETRSRLRTLQTRAAALEPDAEQRRDWLDLAAAHAERLIESLADAPGYGRDDEAAVDALAAGLPESSVELAELLEVLAEGVDRVGVNEGAGHFFGFIPGSGSYAGALGDYLAAVSNRFVGVGYAGPGAVRMERQLIAWMAREVGFPESAEGDLTSGGSIANLSAIVTAREACGVRAADVPNCVVYLSEQSHHSLRKALLVAGVSDVHVRTVPADSRDRMDADVLAGLVVSDRASGLRPWLLLATAGATDTGAVDPLEHLADLADRERLWLHVDAAYGGAFVLCDAGRERLAGIDRADSLVIDPHKGLFAPFGTGLLLVRDGLALRRAFGYEASYMQDVDRSDAVPLSPSETSPELTRPFRGLRLWLALRLAGVDAYRAALEEKLLLARYFHERLSKDSRFEVGPVPDLSVVTFCLRSPNRADQSELNRRLVDEIQSDGRIYLGSTTIRGRFTIRFAVLNARSHVEQVDLALEVLDEMAAQVVASAGGPEG